MFTFVQEGQSKGIGTTLAGPLEVLEKVKRENRRGKGMSPRGLKGTDHHSDSITFLGTPPKYR
jgi:hypothetical protein